ncbi:MAG: methylenetetrahydrofolate reductase [Leptospirales bacterium]
MTKSEEQMNFNIDQTNAESVLDILKKNKFTYSAEIIPPRNGTDFKEVFSSIATLTEGGFDFLSVTHGAGGSLRGGTMPIAFQAQNAYKMTSIAHLTCRGQSKEELENSLIDHHYFGIHNILALRGDPPDGINEKFVKAEGGFEYAHELVDLIAQKNRGEYIKRKGYDDENEFRRGMETRFCIGVAAYPEDPDGNDIEYLRIKKEKGAQFCITQIVLNNDLFFSFFEKVYTLWGNYFPVLPGIRIPTSWKQLSRMHEKFGISVDADLYADMEKNKDSKEAMREVGMSWAREFIEELKIGGVPGVHIFVMGDPDTAVSVRHNQV